MVTSDSERVGVNVGPFVPSWEWRTSKRVHAESDGIVEQEHADRALVNEPHRNPLQGVHAEVGTAYSLRALPEVRGLFDRLLKGIELRAGSLS